MYTCAELDTSENCITWVEQMYLLPPLSTADAIEIGTAIIFCWIVAVGVRIIYKLLTGGREF